MDIFLKVFLKSSAGEVELSTHDQEAPYRLLDGTRGFGLPQRSLESSPIASGNGSALRSQRFDETEMMLPISIRGSDASDVATKARELEHILMPASNEPIEIRVVAPQLSTTRRRFIYYTGGLEGAIGSQDSHWVWRHAQVTFQALDPMWYGRERVIPQRVDQGRKPFITSKIEDSAENVRRETRAPTADDPGSEGDVWLVGEYGPGRNYIRNGGPEGSAVGWPEDSVYESSGGPNGGPHISFAPGKGYSYAFRDMGTVPLVEGDTLYFECWVKADRPNSRLYVTVHNQDGSGTSTANRITGWESVEGDAAAIAPVVSWVVPTEWTKIVSKTTIGPGVTEGKLQGFYFNYSAGSEREAGYSLAGLKLYKSVFKTQERYQHNGSEWVLAETSKRVPFFPIILASSVIEGAYQLKIQGDANAWPIWEVTGPGEDLLIENIETEERIFIRGKFGEKVTIDTRPTIADIYSETDDDGELWERVDDDYQLFPLKPGLNKIKITMVNSRPHSLITLRYSETWLAGW